MIKKIKTVQALLFGLMQIGVIGSGYFIFFQPNKLAAIILIAVVIISAFAFEIINKIKERE